MAATQVRAEDYLFLLPIAGEEACTRSPSGETEVTVSRACGGWGESSPRDITRRYADFSKVLVFAEFARDCTRLCQRC